MKLDYLKQKKKLISIILLWFSVLLGIVILVKVADFFVTLAKAEGLIEDAVVHSRLDPNDTERYFAESGKVAEQLKKKNLFVTPEPKQHPVKQISGILGNEVLIKGKWYKAGDKIGDAKITAIEPTQVRIEWDGKEKTFAPINAASAAKPKKKVKKPPVKKPESKKIETPVQEPAEEQAIDVPEEDPLAWMGVKLSPKARKRLLEMWNKMSDEQKQRWKERWNNMSDEQKQQAVDSMEQHL